MVANEEHRELISFANADDALWRIRDWIQASGVQSGNDPKLSRTVSAPHKKQKITQPVPHQSFARPSPHFHAQRGALSMSYGGVLANIQAVKEAVCNPLIGKRVRTRWPDGSNFYVALKTDYNAVKGRHALVYYRGTANETWKWVHIAEIDLFIPLNDTLLVEIKRRPAIGPAVVDK